MAKKTALKMVTTQRTSPHRKPFTGAKGAEGASSTTTESPSAWAQTVLEEATQVFSSEEQALSFLVDSVTSKLVDSGPEKAQMHEFLSLLLDTDPTLREEILAAVTIRK